MICAVFDTKPYDRHFLEAAAKGTPVEFRFHEFRLGKDTVKVAEGAVAVCVFVNDKVDRETLEALSQTGIRAVVLRCAGFNNVDLEAARSLGISVARVPAYSPHAVAEHALALLLTLNRKIHRAYNRVREQNFSLNGLVGFDLAGKTVGIVGTGKIGRITAEIFRGLSCEVIAFDTTPDTEWAASRQIRYLELDDVLATADIVSLHVPLFPETFHLLDRETLGRMKRGVHIINTSRGKLIDTKALIESLKSGQVGGVGLDVYEEEEGIFFEDHSGEVLQDDDLSLLMTFPNVLVTSHQAFLTNEALAEIASQTVMNLLGLESREGAPASNLL